jgi:hypothetical protein
MAARPFAIELVHGPPGQRSQERLPNRFATEDAARNHALLLCRQERPVGVRVVELEGENKTIVWIHPPELAHRSMLLANQFDSPLLWLVAAGAGVVFLLSRRGRAAPALPPAPTSPTPPRCVGTVQTLEAWANSRDVPLLFLPRETRPPTRSDVAAEGYNVADLVVVLSDTSFWTYTSAEQPVSRRDLRSDYCATVT